MPTPVPDLSILTRGRTAAPPDAPGGDPACADFGISIARDGTWFHNGLPFTRLPLVRLFSTVLRRAPNGDYLLSTPVERGRIAVEDVPFVGVEMAVAGEGRERSLRFRTNIGQWVEAGAAHPLWLCDDPATGEPVPYLIVKPGIEARIVRPVFYDLVALAEDLGPYFGVWAGGVFHPLGPAQGDGEAC
jgi:hypothetical protein